MKTGTALITLFGLTLSICSFGFIIYTIPQYLETVVGTTQEVIFALLYGVTIVNSLFMVAFFVATLIMFDRLREKGRLK